MTQNSATQHPAKQPTTVPPHAMSPHDDLDAVQSAPGWYYSIEMKPGQFTSGAGHQNFALTRRLLRRCDVRGRECLDIGTMEGVTPVLLKRAGAKRIVAVDAQDLSPKINAVKRAYGVEFEYCAGLPSSQIADRLYDRHRLNRTFRSRESAFGFDLVVLSGVLYHVFNPFQTLGVARSMLRTGGLMLVETIATQNPENILRYNDTGLRYVYNTAGAWTNTWHISTSMLDHMLRFFRLEPLDCLYFDQQPTRDSRRVAVIARAVDHIPSTTRETFMQRAANNFEYNFMFRDNMGVGATTPVDFQPINRDRMIRSETSTCDIFATIERTAPIRPERDELVLRLADRD